MEVIVLFLPIIIVLLPMLIKKVGIKTIVNGLYYGIITTIAILIVDSFVNLITSGILQSLNNILTSDLTIGSFIVSFLCGALPEETIKFVGLKISKPNNKETIFINALLIALVFSFIENILYSSSGDVSVTLLRLSNSGHIIYQIILSIFMIKALEKNKKSYNFMGLCVALLVHQAFNFLSEIKVISYIKCGICILAYVYIIITIMKMNKFEEKNVKMFVPKIIFIIIVFLFFTNIGLTSRYSIGDKVSIGDNILMTVDNYSCNDYIYLDKKYRCIVSTKIENNTNKDFIISLFDYKIVNAKEYNRLNGVNFDDDREYWMVKAGEKTNVEFYFYTNNTNYTQFVYNTSFSKNSTSYTFSLAK